MPSKGKHLSCQLHKLLMYRCLLVCFRHFLAKNARRWCGSHWSCHSIAQAVLEPCFSGLRDLKDGLLVRVFIRIAHIRASGNLWLFTDVSTGGDLAGDPGVVAKKSALCRCAMGYRCLGRTPNHYALTRMWKRTRQSKSPIWNQAAFCSTCRAMPTRRKPRAIAA